MKKILLILVVAVFLSSCGSGNVVREARKTVNGDWVLTSITYPGSTGEYNVTLFRDTMASCLENSQWNFVSNNNTGSYAPTLAQCDKDPRFFIWSVEEVDASTGTYHLMLKPTDADYDSTTGNQGFRINIVALTGNEMIWEHQVNFEGSPFTVRMNFNRN